MYAGVRNDNGDTNTGADTTATTGGEGGEDVTSPAARARVPVPAVAPVMAPAHDPTVPPAPATVPDLAPNNGKWGSLLDNDGKELAAYQATTHAEYLSQYPLGTTSSGCFLVGGVKEGILP